MKAAAKAAPKTEIVEIQLEGDHAGKIAVSGKRAGSSARYHLWIFEKTLKPCDGWLYRVDDKGARQLDASNSRIAEQLLAAVPGLIDAYREVLEDRRRGREVDAAIARRRAKVEKAGPQLLAHLETMIAAAQATPAGRELIAATDAAVRFIAEVRS